VASISNTSRVLQNSYGLHPFSHFQIRKIKLGGVIEQTGLHYCFFFLSWNFFTVSLSRHTPERHLFGRRESFEESIITDSVCGCSCPQSSAQTTNT
jgi:hypothetical protein